MADGNHDGYDVITGQANGSGRSMGELFRELARDTQALFSQEVRLAKLEISQGLKNAQRGAIFLAGAAVFGLVGLIALAFTLVALLSLVLPVWASALIVTVLFFAAAGAMGLAGKNVLAKANPAPQETIQTLKEDQEWLKQQMR